MQEQLLKDVQDRMTSTLRAMDPETMMMTWLPASLKGVEQWQEMFLSKMGGAQRRDK